MSRFKNKRNKTQQKMIGNVPFETVIKGNDKGRFIAQANIGGKQYEASGETKRQAQLALTKQVNFDVHANDVPHVN